MGLYAGVLIIQYNLTLCRLSGRLQHMYLYSTCMYQGQPYARDNLIDFIPQSGTMNLVFGFNPGVFRHREIWGPANVAVLLYSVHVREK